MASGREIDRLRDRIADAGGLVNAGDLARVWALSRARVSELVAMGDFPEPVGAVGGRPVWLLQHCDRWREARTRARTRSSQEERR